MDKQNRLQYIGDPPCPKLLLLIVELIQSTFCICLTLPINIIFFDIFLRLVTKDTVDENVFEIANRKLTLDAAVLQSGVEVEDEGMVPDKTMGEILSYLLLG